MDNIERQAKISLGRIAPRLEREFAAHVGTPAWDAFMRRLRAHFGDLFAALAPLYGAQYDFFYHLESVVATAARMWLARPARLRALDEEREGAPRWFQSERMLGGVLYVDLFAGTLDGVRARIPYFKELGLTYLHLMPPFLAPAGNSDGGYAVSSYREVDPRLGAMEDLARLAEELREEGISIVLDFVFNHTSDEHPWARRARTGDEEYRDYYYIFPDRTLPDQYGGALRDIFPDVRPGSFTYRPDMDAWVWTTFNSFQWDLNYGNPVVFVRMAEEMLSLANRGAETLRLDAVAFAWKRLGTPCESLPEVHDLVRAFNAVARIAAPALLFKSEAIVHPDEVLSYIALDQCQLSYNPLLMALLWESLATRDARLLQISMRERSHIDPRCAWVNYVRSHDDIGWTFDDDDARRVGIDPVGHRQFLNAFYTGRFPGSFARGLPFGENPRTGDARISGTCASLAGLEQAARDGVPEEIELSIRRILLLYGVALTIGGIPLIYLGDELGTPNDYGYRADEAKEGDSRWAHRPATDWSRAARRDDLETIEGRVYTGFRRLITLRQGAPALADGALEVVETGNGSVFGYVRHHADSRVLALANFSEAAQAVAANAVRLYGLGYAFTDLVTGGAIVLGEDTLVLEPYQLMCLAPATSSKAPATSSKAPAVERIVPSGQGTARLSSRPMRQNPVRQRLDL